MKDSYKIILLILSTIIVAVLFVGHGLTVSNYEYFLSRRVPKVLAIMVAAVAIGQSSLAFQTITQNRILTPSIMGFDFLYQLIQIMLVALLGGFSGILVNVYWNFSLSASVMLLFSFGLFSFYFRGGRGNLFTLLLLGVVIGQVFNNLSSFFVMLMDPNDFSAVQANFFASFNNANVNLVYSITPVLILVSWILYRYNRVLDVFWLERDNATSLGVDVPRVTRNILLISALLISISTALVGPIMFFGLLMTNLTREWFRSYQHKYLLLGCSAMSACALLAGQWIVERWLNFETTLSVVINFIGGLYFLTLLMRNKVV